MTEPKPSDDSQSFLSQHQPWLCTKHLALGDMEPSAPDISMKQTDDSVGAGRLWALQVPAGLGLVEMSAFMLIALDGRSSTNNKPTEMT